MTEIDIESEWKSVIGFKNYESNSKFQIRNKNNKQILKKNIEINRNTIFFIKTDDGKNVKKKLHQLVDIPEEKHQLIDMPEEKDDNDIEIWKEIPVFSKYELNSLFQIRNKNNQQILKKDNNINDIDINQTYRLKDDNGKSVLRNAIQLYDLIKKSIEIWIPIEGFSKYEISNLYHVRNCLNKKIFNDVNLHKKMRLKNDNGKSVSKDISQLVVMSENINDDEEWRTIPGFKKYEASNQGNIRNKSKKFKTLKPSLSIDGYKNISIIDDNGKAISKGVHQVIALTFIQNINNECIIEVKFVATMCEICPSLAHSTGFGAKSYFLRQD